jgi:methionine sulfoxide reductase heme-binding subunit
VSHSWWYLSRAAGIVAWALLSASVIWGLALSTRVFDRKPSPKWFTDLHRFLGGTAVVFVAVHVGTIVADSYVHFGAADVLVPFASRWHPVAIAWGVVALWLVFAIEVSSLAMRFLPRRVWHAIHLSSYLLFVSATMHALASGPDTRKQAFELALSAVVAVVTLLTLVRVATPKRKGGARPRPSVPASRKPDSVERVDAGAR